MSTETRPTEAPEPGAANGCIRLTMLMPAFNEEANVDSAVRRALAALERHTKEFEILIINDGSTDSTGRIADALASEDARVRVLHHDKNENYGVALRNGIAMARYEWILHDGMDLPLAPEDLDKFTPHCASADVIVACRTSRRAHSPWRKITSWTNNLLLRVLFNPRTMDLNFVQLYRRSFVQSVDILSTSPAFITAELILRAERSGREVREVTAEFRRREAGKAHFGKPRDILWTLKDMLRLRCHTWLRGWNG